MRFSPKILLIHGLAKWCSHFTMFKRLDILIRFIRLTSHHDHPKEKLKFLLDLDKNLYKLEQNASVEYGNGLHPKHRLINYKQFFIKNLRPNECVLDIGSGNGYLSYEVVSKVPGVKVTAIELDKKNVEFARKKYKHPNLFFIQGDALKNLPKEKFDVVILSNILEHLEKRNEFLKEIVAKINPSRLIVRIPMLERDWRVPLKKELGIDYRLDDGHHIEYTKEEYFEELNQANLKVNEVEFRWGEIWSVIAPISK